jgi:hypothetical protein
MTPRGATPPMVGSRQRAWCLAQPVGSLSTASELRTGPDESCGMRGIPESSW